MIEDTTMTNHPFPPKEELTIHFAHVAYNMATQFQARETGINHFQTWTGDDTRGRIGDAHVLVVSGFWQNDLLELGPKLRFIQSIGAGYDQFPQDELMARGIRLASAKGVNKNAVSEHAMAHILAFARQIHTGRDNQRNHHWRGMIADIPKREDELPGKTLLIFGMGDIGSRVAKLAKAFDMHVIGVKRNPATAQGPADEVHPTAQWLSLLPKADYILLTSPLTPDTANIMNEAAFEAMKSSAYLINMARGGCVDEDALVQALQSNSIAGAGLDVTIEEPLAQDSPLWDMDNVIVTPHTAGETQKYEDNVLDILMENLERLWRGEMELVNQIV